MIPMYKFVLSVTFIFTLLSTVTAQQKNYFIFFQQENYTPFYIKYESKIFSSTEKGYLILSKLKTGNHKIEIGFPKSQEKPMLFECNINDNDLGFIVKKYNQDWVLSNLNNNSIITKFAPPVIMEKEIIKAPIKATPAENPVEVSKEIANEVTKPLTVDTTTGNIENINKNITQVKEVEVNKDQQIELRNEVKLLFKKPSDKGTDLIYTIVEDNKNDTIRIFIPDNLKPEPKVNIEKIDTISKMDNKGDQFLKFEVKNPNNKEKDWSIPAKKNDDITTKTESVNTSCKKIADDEDYISLRKKMAGEINESKMLELAKKAFSQRCYTVQHIKNLSVLFIDENSKFDFIKLSYPFVYDKSNYSSLVKLLNNEQFISQFNSLINN
jgi:hypothetical protein